MLDEEQIEDQLYSANLTRNVLGMDLEAFERFRKNASQGLIKFGGSFAYHLGMLLRHCDHVNSVKLCSTWRRECMEHEMLYRIYKAKEDAKSKTSEPKE